MSANGKAGPITVKVYVDITKASEVLPPDVLELLTDRDGDYRVVEYDGVQIVGNGTLACFDWKAKESYYVVAKSTDVLPKWVMQVATHSKLEGLSIPQGLSFIQFNNTVDVILESCPEKYIEVLEVIRQLESVMARSDSGSQPALVVNSVGKQCEGCFKLLTCSPIRQTVTAQRETAWAEYRCGEKTSSVGVTSD